MGTRSLTIIKDFDKEIVVMYRQFDGYPEGHGAELADFLSGFKVVNGFTDTHKVANGAGCLAAQIVQHFKDGTGNIYLYPAGTRDCGEEWIYVVTAYEGHLSIAVFDTYPELHEVFSGTPEEVAEWIKSMDEESD